MPSAEVYILGQKYSIKGDSSEEEIRELSGYINEKVKEVCNKYPNITPLQAMILTSFNIAADLRNLRDEQTDITNQIEKSADLLSTLIESA